MGIADHILPLGDLFLPQEVDEMLYRPSRALTEKADVRPENANLELERADLSLESAGLRLERSED